MFLLSQETTTSYNRECCVRAVSKVGGYRWETSPRELRVGHRGGEEGPGAGDGGQGWRGMPRRRTSKDQQGRVGATLQSH